ncbi:hypothetical protein MVEG_08300 [Podila verticillata NRRL 6337]|nr:hypothetical protein MVEG_08300 [Podila verticillata NRRL 6337]
MSELLWHPIPGRLQSVSVANKSSIWGVTLDLQLAKLNTSTRQWQLVSVTTEQATRNRYSSSSSHSNNTLGSNSTTGSASGRAGRTIAALLPAFGMASGGTRAGASTNVTPSPSFEGFMSFLSPRGGEEDQDEDNSTVQVSAAADGTVVRLDKALKAWYLIGPHNDKVDFERDVIWIELGHFWKCVSVASISQIWGLSDSGDIYYGSSDRFLQLEAAVTSGAGYGQPNFTHISVGLDNVVLATDAHTGTVFRLKRPDTTITIASHPPIWKALPGTGPRGLHIVNCSLSTSDFMVGVAMDGQSYRFCNSRWVAMGGGAKLDNVGVGADGYVVGVDRDGDLFGFQLESLVVVPKVPKAISTDGKGYDYRYKQEYEAMEMPKTPTQQKSFSRRPMASPRELFEMAVNDRGNDVKLALGAGAVAAAATTVRSPLGATSPYSPRGNAYSRYTVVRSESQMSKRSYASDIASGMTTPTPTGLNIFHAQEPSTIEEASPDLSESELEMQSPHPKSSLQTRTKRTDDSYFAPFPQGDTGHQKSPASGFPVDGNPYSATRSLASSQNNFQRLSPGSAALTPMASNSTIGSSSLSNDLTKELSLSQSDYDGDNNKESDSDDSVDLAKVHRIHALALAGKSSGDDHNKQSTGSLQQQGGEHAKPLTPPPEVEVGTKSFEQKEGPGEKAEAEVLDMSPTEPENIRQELSVVTNFDKEDGNSGRVDSHGSEENHNVNTHLHSPPMTTPEEDKKQPFTTTPSNGLGPSPSAGGPSVMDKGMDHKVGGGDTLHVQAMEMAPDHAYMEEYKKQLPVLSFDEVTVHPSQPYQPYQPQHPQHPKYSTPSSFPEKQDYNEYIPTEPGLDYLDPRPGSTHRSSGSSDEFMLQQQEFLRLTRLRSQSLKNNLNNQFSIGKSEFDNIKEEEPSAIPLQSFYSLSTKTELDYPTTPSGYPGPYQQQYHHQQQQAKQEYHPYSNSTTPLASPSNITNNNYNYNYSNNNMPTPMVSDLVPSRTPKVPPIISSSSFSQRSSSPHIQPQPQPSQQQPPPPPGKKEADPDDEAPSRPSYSSSHLQNYVDTTMVLQSGLASAERRQSQGQLAGLSGYQQNLRQRTSVGGVQGLASQGGIQGEDEQGRWIGGARPGSEVRQWGTEDVHKGKCCTIL